MILRSLIFIFIATQLSFSQKNFDRMNLIPLKDYKKESIDSSRIIILDNKILIDQSTGSDELFKTSSRIRSYEVLRDYYYLTAYRYEKTTILKFWKKEIVLFISDDFPKEVKKDLQSFVSQINETGTFAISLTDDKEESNLMILNHNSVSPYYQSSFLEKLNTGDIEKLLFYNTTYNITGHDSQIDSGYIKVRLDRIESEDILKYSLRKILYASLGPFYDSENLSSKSILSRIPKPEASLTEYDKNMLRIHFDHITDLKVTGWDIHQDYIKE